MKCFISLISIFIVLEAKAVIKRCGGQLMSIDDRIQIRLEYTIDNESNRPYGEAIVINSNTETKFYLHCYDKIIDKKYFICEPREDYINAHLLVFMGGEVKFIQLEDNGNSYYKLSTLTCDSPYIKRLIEDKEWLLD